MMSVLPALNTMNKMGLDELSVNIPSSNKTRPNSWGFDLSSVASSGYCSAENSTETEHPPFDWDSVCDRLEKLETPKVTLHALEEKQYALNDCFFTVEVTTESGEPAPGIRFDTLEAYVEGPSGHGCEVHQNPGQTPGTVVCTFRPLDCGPHTCHVKLWQSQVEDPEPLVVNIDRSYGKQNPITQVVLQPPAEAPIKVKGETLERKPWGICQDRKRENLYVTCRNYHEILVYGPEGDLEFRFGGRGSANGKFFRPCGVVYDDVHDRILVTDKDNHRIQIFNPNGTFVSSFGRRGSYPGQFMFPWGIAVSPDGNYIAIVDSRNHRIQLFDHQGNFLRLYYSGSKSFKKEFNYPRGVCFDATGENLFVTDFNLHALFKLPLDFSSCERILDADQLYRPEGIALNRAGNILLCDAKNNAVKVVSPTGKILQEYHRLGRLATIARIEAARDIEVLAGGYVCLLDIKEPKKKNEILRIRVF